MPPLFLEGVVISCIGLGVVFASLASIAQVVRVMAAIDRRKQDRPSLCPASMSTIDETTMVIISSAVTTMLQGRGRIHRIHTLRSRDAGATWSMQGRLMVHGSHAVPRKLT